MTLVYSSSGVSPTYVVNGISAPVDADLTRIDSWRKWSSPLQKSMPMPAGDEDYRRYEQGPGHGAFTSDEDGNPSMSIIAGAMASAGTGGTRASVAFTGRPMVDLYST
ncbi:hypothetical protein P0F65_07345 [Sphingomonas sp. I4]